MFEIRRSEAGEVFLSGRFDASRVQEAEAVFGTITESTVVDLKDLDYISSAGLGVFVATYRRLKDLGKTLALRNMSRHVADVFRLTGLDKLFEIR